jgi:hypothetical protein
MNGNREMIERAIHEVRRTYQHDFRHAYREMVLRISELERVIRDLKTVDRAAGAPVTDPLVVTTVSTTYTVLTTDDVVLCDTTGGAFTVTLYAATSGGSVSIKNIGASALTIDGDGAETIDGSLTQILSLYDAADLVSDGSNWFIV